MTLSCRGCGAQPPAIAPLPGGLANVCLVTPASASFRITDPGAVLMRAGLEPEPTPRLDLVADWGVAVSSPGFGGDTIVIRYDAIGLGRIANRTLRFERGRAVAGLTISAYGRVRAW